MKKKILMYVVIIVIVIGIIGSLCFGGFIWPNNFFADNYSVQGIDVSKTNIYKGAYHYFTTKSSGKDQALNFINTVPIEKGCLPPAVDIEEECNDKIKFINELTDYLNIIEKKYNQKPIIYTVNNLYQEYIKDYFKGYDIWIRDIIKPAKLSDNRRWIMWQYCSRGRIKGIDTYVDLNVYKDDIDNLELLLSN